MYKQKPMERQARLEDEKAWCKCLLVFDWNMQPIWAFSSCGEQQANLDRENIVSIFVIHCCIVLNCII